MVDVLAGDNQNDEVFSRAYRVELGGKYEQLATLGLAPGHVLQSHDINGRVPWAAKHGDVVLLNDVLTPKASGEIRKLTNHECHTTLPIVHECTEREELIALDKTMLSKQKLRFALDEAAWVPMDNLIGIVTKVWVNAAPSGDPVFAAAQSAQTPIRIELVLATMKNNGFCKRPLRLVREAPSEQDLAGLQVFHDILVDRD